MIRDLLPPLDDRAIDLLGAILGEIRALRADLAQFPRDPVLAAIAEKVGRNVPFVCSDLIAGTADAEFLNIIGTDAGELGKRLSWYEGRGTQKVGRCADGYIWSLM